MSAYPDYVKRLVPDELFAEIGNVVFARLTTVGTLQSKGMPIHSNYVCSSPEDVTMMLVLALHTMPVEEKLTLVRTLLPDYAVEKTP